MTHHRYTRLFKASFLVSVAPFMMLVVFVINDKLPLADALYGAGFIFCISILFVRPYVTDLIALTHYVEKLALNRRAKTPDLSFLSNIDVLSTAVQHLHTSWEMRKHHLEEIITESKLVFDTLPDGILMVDKNMLVVRANSAAMRKFGYDLVKRSIHDLYANEALIAGIQSVLDGETHISLEITETYSKQAESHYVVNIERFPVASQNGIAAIIVMHDVTEAKRNEAMFADFVANASHEIRTPLTSIVGFIETLQTTAKDDKEAHEQFLAIMSEQAERMTNLVSDLLSLSKIERNADQQPTTTVQVTTILDQVIHQIEWAAEEKSIEIVQKAPNDSLPLVYGDISELTQVVYNLVNNAIKYSAAESTITIHVGVTRRIPKHISLLSGQKQALRIAVEDQGEGIDPRHIPRLTERFYRVDTARTRSEGGSGLGLAIVKHILHRHKGGLHIKSTPGEGSVFAVYLPIVGTEE